VFSVRTAYNMLVATRDGREAWLDHRASSSNEEQIQRDWCSLWKTQVPSKVKVFLWRLANNPSQQMPYDTSGICQIVVSVSFVELMTHGSML
jgi:hypothetical protein